MTQRNRMAWRMWIGLCCLLSCNAVNGAIYINEVYSDPEDPFKGREFFELISDSGGVESLMDHWFLEIEGDLAQNTGRVDQALPLFGSSGAFSTGSNGLFLWRDTAQVLLPPPAVATFVHVQDIAPQLEDGGATYMVVRGFTGSVGMDLDTNNDGVLDTLPWTSVSDAVSNERPDRPGFGYAGQVGGFDFGTIPGYDFSADALARLPGIGQWFAFDSSSGAGDANYVGPFYANDESDALLQDGTRLFFPTNSTDYFLTPGNANMMIPEPAALWTVLTGLVALSLRRFRAERIC